jgi:hypothetical protein
MRKFTAVSSHGRSADSAVPAAGPGTRHRSTNEQSGVLGSATFFRQNSRNYQHSSRWTPGREARHGASRSICGLSQFRSPWARSKQQFGVGSIARWWCRRAGVQPTRRSQAQRLRDADPNRIPTTFVQSLGGHADGSLSPPMLNEPSHMCSRLMLSAADPAWGRGRERRAGRDQAGSSREPWIWLTTEHTSYPPTSCSVTWLAGRISTRQRFIRLDRS